MFDRISIAHAHFDAMYREYSLPVVHNMRRLPRWSAHVRLRENRVIAA